MVSRKIGSIHVYGNNLVVAAFSRQSEPIDYITVYVQIVAAEPIGQVGRSPTKASEGRPLPYQS